MKRIIITFVIFVFVSKVQSQITLDSLLVKYYNLAITSKDSNLYKEIFFETFPNSFQLFDSIYGYKDINSDSTYFSPLYDVSMEHIELFFTLINITDKSIFIKKTIDISLKGHYEVDAVNIFNHELQKLFLSDVEYFLKELEQYTDIEIKSFWHFFFDNNIFDHPYNISRYGKVYRKVKELNYTRILTLLQEQFQYDFHQYIGEEHDTDNN